MGLAVRRPAPRASAPYRFEARLPDRPRELYGTRGSALLADSSGQGSTIAVLRGEDPPAKIPLPPGDAAATF